MPRPSLVSWTTEIVLWRHGYQCIAGIDEAGRGALAGPVVAAAVVLAPHTSLEHVDDSKRLSPEQREHLYQQIQTGVAGIGLGIVAASEIDAVDVRQATLRAMCQAIGNLPRAPDYLLIDGCDAVPLLCQQRTIVRGDQRVGSIAAASIVAKVTRDRLMVLLDGEFPGYGLAQHKGYGTVAHRRAIHQLGPSAVHRMTFRGVHPMVQRHG